MIDESGIILYYVHNNSASGGSKESSDQNFMNSVLHFFVFVEDANSVSTISGGAEG